MSSSHSQSFERSLRTYDSLPSSRDYQISKTINAFETKFGRNKKKKSENPQSFGKYELVIQPSIADIETLKEVMNCQKEQIRELRTDEYALRKELI